MFIMCLPVVKAQLRLPGCADWSEHLLVTLCDK